MWISQQSSIRCSGARLIRWTYSLGHMPLAAFQDSFWRLRSLVPGSLGPSAGRRGQSGEGCEQPPSRTPPKHHAGEGKLMRTFEGPGSNTAKIPREDTQEREERREKKNAKFWAVRQWRGPAEKKTGGGEVRRRAVEKNKRKKKEKTCAIRKLINEHNVKIANIITILFQNYCIYNKNYKLFYVYYFHCDVVCRSIRLQTNSTSAEFDFDHFDFGQWPKSAKVESVGVDCPHDGDDP